VGRLFSLLSAALETRFERGFDPAISTVVDPSEMAEPAGLLLIARLRERPVGCGALRFHAGAPAELKRVWLAPEVRGLGIGRRLLAVLANLLMAPLARTLRETKKSLPQDAREGLRYVLRFRWLVALLLIDTCAALAAVGPISIGLPLLAQDVLHVGAEGYSLLLWSFGLGSVLGFILADVYSPTRARGRFYCLVQVLEAPLLAGVAFTPLPLAMCCLAAVGLLNGILVVIALSLIQANVSKEMLGRVMSFVMLASVGFVPLSLYGSGAIAAAWGTRTLFLMAGGLTLVRAVTGLCVQWLRRLD
jgi:DHA3 family tetracycline resistance protein-like MFS transporter